MEEELDQSSQEEDDDSLGETNKKKEHPLTTAFKRRKPMNDAKEQCLQFVKDIDQEESCSNIW